MHWKILLVILFTMIMGNSCDQILDMPSETVYEEKIVVNALLMANFPIDSIRVHTSSRIDEPFDARSNALSDAFLTLEGPGFLDTLVEDIWVDGVYHLPRIRIAQEGQTYTLRVSHEKYPDVEATTTIPGPIRMTNITVHSDTGLIAGFPDTVVYRPVGEDGDFLNPIILSFDLEYDTTAPPYLVRQINIALEPTEENMILEDDSLKAFFYKWRGHGTDEEGMQYRLAEFTATSFNSTIFHRRYEVSWHRFTFYGPQVFFVMALDEAYLNYHKGFLEGPPRNINYLPESNVIGGYGLFSSSNVGNNIKFYYLQRPDAGSG
jgi:hypothetical protein